MFKVGDKKEKMMRDERTKNKQYSHFHFHAFSVTLHITVFSFSLSQLPVIVRWETEKRHEKVKIQPLDFSHSQEVALPRHPVVKSRLKKLIEFQFTNVLKNSAIEKVVETVVDDDESPVSKECGAEFEPSFICLAKMVRNFMKDNNKKKQSGVVNVRCGHNRSNCFNNRNRNDSSKDEADGFGFSDSNLTPSAEAYEILKNLVPCGSLNERDLLAHTTKIVEKNKITKRKDDINRKIVTNGLLAVGYHLSPSLLMALIIAS